MVKPEELALIDLVKASGGRVPSCHWELLTKREYGYLQKWSNKGLWDFGVSIRSGWLTEKGRREFQADKGSVK